MAAEIKYIGDVDARWLLGSRCFRFTVSIQIGRSGTYHARAEVEADELLAAAEQLKTSDQPAWTLQHPIKHRGGARLVPIHVPREMVLEIAHAIAGAHDLDDVGHLFWHYCYPEVRRPCSSCYETVAAADAAAWLVAVIRCVLPLAAAAQLERLLISNSWLAVEGLDLLLERGPGALDEAEARVSKMYTPREMRLIAERDAALTRAEAAEAWAAQFSPLTKRAADALADEVAALVRRKVIDSRSPAADALLDYRNPPSTERADRLAALEHQIDDVARALECTPEEISDRIAQLRRCAASWGQSAGRLAEENAALQADVGRAVLFHLLRAKQHVETATRIKAEGGDPAWDLDQADSNRRQAYVLKQEAATGQRWCTRCLQPGHTRLGEHECAEPYAPIPDDFYKPDAAPNLDWPAAFLSQRGIP